MLCWLKLQLFFVLFHFAVFIQIILNDLQEESAKALKDIKIGQNAIQMRTGWAEQERNKRDG